METDKDQPKSSGAGDRIPAKGAIFPPAQRFISQLSTELIGRRV
jgi:hypothetical protein